VLEWLECKFVVAFRPVERCSITTQLTADSAGQTARGAQVNVKFCLTCFECWHTGLFCIVRQI